MQANSFSIFKRLILTYSYIQLEAKRYHRSIISIILEMLYLCIKNGFGPNYYLLAGMADKNMSWHEKCQHINHAQYHRALNILNPIPYRKLTQHKLTEKAFLQLAKIPTADFIGYYHPLKGFDDNGDSLRTYAALERLMLSFQGGSICIKIPEGSCGQGFFAGEVQENEQDSEEIILKPICKLNTIPLEALLEDYKDVIEHEGIILEHYIKQTKGYARFNPASVNTVRVWVLQTKGTIEVIGAYFRIGRKDSIVDNSGAGGIVCPVDHKTGKLAKGIFTATPYRENIEHHCDSQVPLYNEVLPRWQEILDCSCETLRKLPYTNFAGLDICMSDSGPLVIEVNVAPDKDGAAYANIPSSLLLKAANELMTADRCQ
ncbi:MAG: hypothetical protein HRT55_03560 [Colwellia sp.]|uniref:sugar-transfer associated ATP-grasp domain-containing protein n=1 Tax=Colwellia sp. TaxID=56799 RepID=UPI0025C6A845|nr:sugar-transfer associated ATP-grasp domain-containing protein [Colwellia sp.]NQZ25374.1 hypothetical protein [Colwellia sp.]